MANVLGNYDRSEDRQRIPSPPPPTPEQIAAAERARLAGQRASQLLEIESPTGERINIAPADLPTWRGRGWRVVLPEGD